MPSLTPRRDQSLPMLFATSCKKSSGTSPTAACEWGLGIGNCWTGEGGFGYGPGEAVKQQCNYIWHTCTHTHAYMHTSDQYYNMVMFIWTASAISCEFHICTIRKHMKYVQTSYNKKFPVHSYWTSSLTTSAVNIFEETQGSQIMLNQCRS